MVPLCSTTLHKNGECAILLSFIPITCMYPPKKIYQLPRALFLVVQPLTLINFAVSFAYIFPKPFLQPIFKVPFIGISILINHPARPRKLALKEPSLIFRSRSKPQPSLSMQPTINQHALIHRPIIKRYLSYSLKHSAFDFPNISIYVSVREYNFAPSVWDIVLELTSQFCSVFEFIHADSLPLVGLEWTDVDVRVGVGQGTEPMKSPLGEVALVGEAFGLLVDSLALGDTVFEIALEYIPIIENYPSDTLQIPHTEIARTHISIAPRKHTRTVNSIATVSLALKAIPALKLNLPLHKGPLLEIAFEFFSGIKSEDTFPFERPVIQLAFIGGHLVAILHEGHLAVAGGASREFPRESVPVFGFEAAGTVGFGVVGAGAFVDASVWKRNNELLSHSKINFQPAAACTIIYTEVLIMQPQQFKSPRYTGPRVPRRLSQLKRKNREKVSFVCDMPSRDHSLMSRDCDNSKLKLKHQISKSFCLHKKLVTEPQANHQMFRFPDNSDDSIDQQDLQQQQFLPKLPLLLRKDSHESSQPAASSTKITPKPTARPIGIPQKLLISVQKSQNSNKSRSIKHLPRVIDVFELYDRRRKRKEMSSNVSSVLDNSVEREKRSRKEFVDETLLSPVLTVEDFDIQDQDQGSALRIKDTLKKHLAAVNHNISKLDNLQMQEHIIPFLPLGKNVVFIIYQNWGDQQYIGLNGVQFFNQRGDPITPSKTTSTSPSIQTPNPSQHNLSNLLSGVYYTTSPSHSFLTPFSSSKSALLSFSFQQFIRLSLIRIWNYNCPGKPQCGVKTLEIKLDGTCIFAGNVKRAEGRLKDYWRTCEYIVMTDEQTVLDRISQRDWMNKMDFGQMENSSEESMLSLNTWDETVRINGNSTVEVEVMENYGNREAFRFAKIMLYDGSDNQLKYTIREGKAKEYPIFIKGLNLDILDRKLVEHIVIRNMVDDRALRRIRVKLDGSKCYEMRLKRCRQDQHLYISTHLRYGWSILKHANVYPCGKQIKITLFACPNSPSGGLNKLQLYDINGCPILRSRQFGYTSTATFDPPSPTSELQPNPHDLLTYSNSHTLTILFDDIIFLGALCLWNSKQQPSLGSKQLHLRINDKVLWSGYLRQYKEAQPLMAVLLAHCPILESKLGQFVVDQDKFTREMWCDNEGKGEGRRAGPWV